MTTAAPPEIDEEVGELDDLDFKEMVAHLYDENVRGISLCGILAKNDAHASLHGTYAYKATFWIGQTVCPRCDAKICEACFAIARTRLHHD